MSEINENRLLSASIYLKNSKLRHVFRTSKIKEFKSEDENSEDENIVQPLVPKHDFSKLDYDKLKQIALTCSNCKLCESRNNVVFGIGNKNSPRIAFIGEGPGVEEDYHGEPFVGTAGQFLTSAITRGMKLKREDVYITNVVKCRPPENRTPKNDEIEICKPYLERELEILKPQTIVCLGETAQHALIGKEEGITKLRGKWLEWKGIPVMPTVHPIYVLNNPSAKRDFWEDLKMVMEKLGLQA